MSFNNEQRQKLIDALNTKRKNPKCPSCGEIQWILAEQYTPLMLQDLTNGIVIGGPSIPAVALVCKYCGFISLHASKILINLPEEDSKNV